MWVSLALHPAAAGGTLAIGGGGLGSVLVHLFIWRAIWRLGLVIWRIPTFGPVIIILLGLAAVALIIRHQAGLGGAGRRGNRSGQGGSGRDSTGPGPRDW